MQTAVKMMNTYVEGWVNWLLPANVNLTAMPIALIDMTDTDPTVEQIEMKMRGFFFPCIGATRYIMTTAKTATAKQKMRNPRVSVSLSFRETAVGPYLAESHNAGSGQSSQCLCLEAHVG
jgi:hypothetical protein